MEAEAIRVVTWSSRLPLSKLDFSFNPSMAARAATFGAVETILVDIDQVIPGQIDEQGLISFSAGIVRPAMVSSTKSLSE